MTRPQRYLNRMIIFLAAVAGVVIVLVLTSDVMVEAFMANPVLNGLILGVLLAGIVYVIRQVLMLSPAVEWLSAYRREDKDVDDVQTPAMLAPVATLLNERRGRASLSTLSMRSLLDSIGARLDEAREISRYTISLLIFLGLLGTFWGLLQTIGAISGTIDALDVTSNDFGAMFDELKAGLSAPLGGMGTAFSSSLFGLAGSVVLGFLDLQAGQAQSRFYNDLEEWLSGMTRLSAAGPGTGEADQSVPAYVSALLEQTAESVDNLQRTFTRSEESREATNQALLALGEKLAILDDSMRGNQGLDDASKDHLKNLDVHVAQLQQNMAQGRNQLMDELRSEIKLLARTIAGALDDNRRK
ncbi:MAG: flagellar motor protein MotA [Alphaproteobacteria bacterium]